MRAQFLPTIFTHRLGKGFVIPVAQVLLDIGRYRRKTLGGDDPACGGKVTQDRIFASREVSCERVDNVTFVPFDIGAGRYTPGVKPTCAKALSVAETRPAAAPGSSPSFLRLGGH